MLRVWGLGNVSGLGFRVGGLGNAQGVGFGV